MPKLEYLRRLWVLMATVFVDMAGFLIVLPLLPFYAKDLDTPDWMVGVLVSAFAVAQLAAAPLWGRLSDHHGRRPVIRCSLLVSAVAFVIFAFADSFWLLLLSRLVQGAGSGTIAVIQAYVSDAVPPKARTQALGWVTVASSAGVTLGPAVGSWSTHLGSHGPGLVAAGLCLVNFVFASIYLGESRERTVPEDGAVPLAPARRTPIKTALLAVLFHPTAPQARLIWIYTGGMMAFMAMNAVMALYLQRSFGVTEETIGYFYSYTGGLSLVTRGLLLGLAVERLGEVRTLRLGAFALFLGFGLVPLAQHLVLFALVVLLIPLGTAFLFPATTSLVSQRSPRGETGQSLGVQQAFGGVSRVLGPLWATVAFQFVSVSSPFWLAAGLLGIVTLAAWRVEEGPAPESVRAAVPTAALEPEPPGSEELLGQHAVPEPAEKATRPL